MKKSFYVVGGILLSMLIATPNVWATTKAYSVGSKYASTVDSTQSDFRDNVTNAAEGYYPHSSLTASYYTNNPNYSYINGTKLGTSRVWFINGHANYDHILTAAQDSTEYRTGMAKYTTNPYNITSITFNNKSFKLVGIGNRSFAATNIITFAGCSTDAGNDTITKTANTKGAKASIGFTNSITSRNAAGKKWLKKYNYSLGADNTVNTAIAQATQESPGSDLALYVNVRGSGSTKISTSNPNSISPSLESVDESYGETKLINPNIDMRVYEEVRMSTDDLYKSISKKQINNIDFKNMKDIIYKDLIDYQEDFKTVIDEIKAYDKDFDVKDYKVVYHMVSENEGFGYLNIYYYIDGKIETNKVYSALINDYIITSINLVGVRKENANITNKLDENSIIKIITEFELNKQQKILDNIELEYKNVNNLLKNNKINIDNLNDNVSRASERYYYDYNTNELQYQLSLTIGFENDSMDINEYVINL